MYVKILIPQFRERTAILSNLRFNIIRITQLATYYVYSINIQFQHLQKITVEFFIIFSVLRNKLFEANGFTHIRKLHFLLLSLTSANYC